MSSTNEMLLTALVEKNVRIFHKGKDEFFIVTKNSETETLVITIEVKAVTVV